MTIIFYITATILILCFGTCFVNSALKDRSSNQRMCDMVIGVVIFIMFMFHLWTNKVI